MMTDLPAAGMAIMAGDTDWKEYVRSLQSSAADAVFSVHDPWPGIAEVFLLPYLAAKTWVLGSLFRRVCPHFSRCT